MVNSKGKRIAIVGAGPGGLSAAIALHQAGYDVKIFERHKMIKPLGGAILINAIIVMILRSYGLYVDDLTMNSIQRFRRYDGRQRVLQKVDPELLKQAGVTGWMAGMMRSELYERMLTRIPDGMIVTDSAFTHYEEHTDGVTLFFENGNTYTADLLVGADGIESRVREQLWGESPLENIGIAVWLGWSELEGPSREELVLNHDELYQFGYAPLAYKGKDCFEWWFVEPYHDNQPEPADKLGYMKQKLAKFTQPVPEMLAAAKEDIFRWIIKYRKPLSQWSKGRVTILGDAAHPTSPYAAYGAGMAIEDGFFLGKSLQGYDLSDPVAIQKGLSDYDALRVKYTNDVVEFARVIGKTFHNAPKPVRMLRDFLFDYTKIPERQIVKSMTGEAVMLLKAVIQAEAANAKE